MITLLFSLMYFLGWLASLPCYSLNRSFYFDGELPGEIGHRLVYWFRSCGIFLLT